MQRFNRLASMPARFGEENKVVPIPGIKYLLSRSKIPVNIPQRAATDYFTVGLNDFPASLIFQAKGRHRSKHASFDSLVLYGLRFAPDVGLQRDDVVAIGNFMAATWLV